MNDDELFLKHEVAQTILLLLYHSHYLTNRWILTGEIQNAKGISMLKDGLLSSISSQGFLFVESVCGILIITIMFPNP